MPRARDGKRRTRRRKKILALTKGYRGARSKLFRTAKDAAAKSALYAYRDRRQRKRHFRRLWIVRISAACRQGGISYSRFMAGLKHAKVMLNRKVLAQLAHDDSEGFQKLVLIAKGTTKAVPKEAQG